MKRDEYEKTEFLCRSISISIIIIIFDLRINFKEKNIIEDDFDYINYEFLLEIDEIS